MNLSNKRKKLFIAIVLSIAAMFLILRFVLVFYGSQSRKPSKDVAGNNDKSSVITIWTVWSNNQSDDGNTTAFYKTLESIKSNFPRVNIKHEAVENEAYKSKIKTAIAANEAPDIFYTWGAGFSKPFVDSEKVLALDEYLKDGTKDRLLEGASTYFTYDGKIYGLPFSCWVAVLYCNKELFEKNGLKLPERYEELITAVKKFRSVGITPITVGEKERWPGMFWQNALAIRTAGAEACQEALNKQASFDKPEFVKSAALLKELVDLKAFNDGALGLNRDESQYPFLEGKIPMYFIGNWFTNDCEKEGSKVKGKIVAMKFPIVKDGIGNSDEYLGGSIEGFMVFSGTTNKTETIKVFKYLVEDLAKESYAIGTSLPCWKLDNEAGKNKNPLTMEIAEQVKSSRNFVLAWDTFLEGDDAETHKDLVEEIFAGGKTPEQFARNMQKLNENIK